jgi:O-acetyl-ADP-ribose deacetylase (regulator of RNase III)
VTLCGEHELSSLAFSAISTGVYGFPPQRAASIAVETTIATLDTTPGLARVVFCCFSEASAELHAQALGQARSCAD